MRTTFFHVMLSDIWRKFLIGQEHFIYFPRKKILIDIAIKSMFWFGGN